MHTNFFKYLIRELKEIKNHRLYKYSNLSNLFSIYFLKRSMPVSIMSSLSSAVCWLSDAQDVTGCGGIAAGYSFKNGWEAAYPETTGYIIETFYDYADYSGKDEFRHRALRMADWLVSIQMPSGAFQGGPIDVAAQPVVFNTGMILFGLVRAYKEEKDKKFLTSAIKSGDWLCEVQDPDGAWRQYTYKGRVHCYKARVAWAMLELYQVTENQRYLEAARKNLDWVVSCQQENGFFRYMGFENENPYTHTIAYTIRGLLESGLILKEERYIQTAWKSADRLFHYFEIKQYLPGQFNAEWNSNVSYSCLTGCAQMSIIWHRMYQYTGDARYLNAALKLNGFLVEKQVRGNAGSEVKGAIAGSAPIWGNYMAYYFPNWAAKFFIDSILINKVVEGINVHN